MNKRIYILFCIAVLLSVSCQKDLPTESSVKYASENEWILSEMRGNYLFRNDIPSSVNYSLKPEQFFNSILSKKEREGKDGGYFYSRIDNKPVQTRSSEAIIGYGAEIILRRNVATNMYSAQVIYVLENSPAFNAGLKRGDVITAINGFAIGPSNLDMLYSGAEVVYSVVDNANAQYLAPTKAVTLQSATSLVNEPIYYNSVISHAGKKVGYIMYNHFTSGVDGDRSYDDKFRTMTSRFKTEGVEEVVLDLRYNGGGEVSSAQTICTLLAPAKALDNIFCFLTDVNNKEKTYYLSSELIRGGQNLNLKRLFVITSRLTASASELVINSLRPYMDDVIIIGEVTEGKTVASTEFKHKDYDHILKPITHRVFNKDRKADYYFGFEPNILYNKEITSIGTLKDIGNIAEPMLKLALDRIALTKSSVKLSNKESNEKYEYIYRNKNSGSIIKE